MFENGSKLWLKLCQAQIHFNLNSDFVLVKTLLSKAVLSAKGPLPSMVIFHQKASSIKGCLSSKVVFH